jgi:hypothetical protein
MKMKQLSIALLLIFTAFQNIKPASQAPRLIVFIIIDELDNEQLLILQPAFSDKGFNRLSREGLRFISLNSGDLSGYPGTRMTSLFSGTTPATHGIIGEQWFDYKDGHSSTLASYETNQLKETLNYNHSRSLSDYLKSIYGPNSKSASISINSPWMIHSLGYSPDHFIAFDLHSGKFFNALNKDTIKADWLSLFNSSLQKTNLLKRQWGPSRDITAYTEYRYLNKEKQSDFRSFLYNMGHSGSPRYDRVAASPFANTILRDLAVAFILNNEFGKDDTPDLLSIGFTARPFTKTNGTILPAEKEDMLLRLDQDIASFIEFLDFELGRNNYLMVLTSAANSAPDINSFGRKGVTTGIFEGDKITSLLNLYLMALHGQGRWVLGFRDGAFYLNRKLIAEKGLDLKMMQEVCARFLLEVAGIARATPTYDFQFETQADLMLSRNFFPRRSGDIYITLFAGWQTPVSSLGSRQTGTSGHNKVPLTIRGWQIEEGALFQDITIQQVVPMILKSMQLPFPTEAEIPEIRLKNR